MSSGDTWIHAIIGAAVTVILSVTGVAPVIGGIVAGYLEAGSKDDGARVGALAGLLAAVPLAVLLLTAGSVIAAVIPFVGFPEAAAGVAGIFVIVLVFGSMLVATVLLSALGGYAGAAIRNKPFDEP